jgi:hypothetical protein
VGAPLDFYYLVRLEGTSGGCRHYLLTRVVQAEFPNWSEPRYTAVATERERERDRLVERYRLGWLAEVCPGPHHAVVEGELQGCCPPGERFYRGHGRDTLDVWFAGTQYGPPWVVLAQATTEAEFWRLVAEDEDLASLGPLPPARLLRVDLMTAGG